MAIQEDMPYELRIYPWRPFYGLLIGGVVRSWHKTHKEAMAHLRQYSQPFGQAMLLWHVGSERYFVDRYGQPTIDRRRRIIARGSRGFHPVHEALIRDWDRMVSMVAREHRATGEGTIAIANRIVPMHHPRLKTGHPIDAAAADYIVTGRIPFPTKYA